MPGPGDRGGKKQRPKDTRGTLIKTLKYLLDYRNLIVLFLMCTFLANVGNLMGPGFAGKAIAAATGKGAVDFETIYHYTKLMLVVYIVSALMNFITSQGMMRLAKRVAQRLRKDIFDKLMTLPVSYFDRNQAGDIISRASYDVDVIATSLATDLVQVLSSSVTVVGSFVMMCVISLPLSLCMCVTIPLSIWYTRNLSKKTRPLYAKRSAAYGRMNGFAEEMFSGQKTILAYAHEGGVADDFAKINQEAADAYMYADQRGTTMGPGIGLINNVGLSLIALMGSVLYLYGFTDLGQISSFVLYSRKFSGPINEIANIISEVFSALAAAERVFRLLEEPEEAADIYNAYELSQPQGLVEMDHVSFGYLKDKEIIHDLSLKAESGKTIAIVGPTGAGKTTIINLLMRFYDVDSGEIRVDGHPICSLTRDSLRRAYAMVLQDTWVFKGTIFENIAYGREGASREDVIRVAKAARIHHYICQLPDGYDTVISEDGGNISKGQKQLLTIARAMLYDTSMLILDEATSNVDTRTEQEVQKAMSELMKGKTSFVIAHRLSTIQNADTILVINGGDVVEQGSHEELMKNKGFYYRLYAAQFE